MGKIVRLELENFKSYFGQQIIGPFKDFSCIIGPNGAGKSNLMDAISFVLGVRTMQLRGGQLKDLIHRKEGETAGRRKCFVRMVYEDNNGMEIQFMRVITPQGSAQYKIDDREVSWEQYEKRLQQENILVKARNFLVFQGDVESVASKSPKDLTALFEQISGSDELKKQYQEALEAKERAEQDTIFGYQKRRGITAEKKQYKQQMEEAQKYQELETQLNQTKVMMFLFELFHIDKELKSERGDLAKLNADLQEVKNRHKKAESSFREKKKAIDSKQKETAAVEKKIKTQKNDIEKKRPSLEKISQQISRLEKSVGDKEDQIKKAQEALKKQDQDIEALEKDLEELQHTAADLEKSRKKEKKSELQMADKQLEDYNNLKEKVGTKTSVLREELNQYLRKQEVEQSEKTTLQARLDDLQKRKSQLVEQDAKLKERLEDLERKAQEAKSDERAKKDQLKEMQDAHHKSSALQAELQQQVEKCQEQLAQLKADKRESERDRQLNQTVADLKRLFSGVYGRMCDLCKPTQRKFNVAVSVAFGRHLDAIVTDTYATGLDCIQYLRDQRLPPITFLALDNIRPKDLNERLRQLGGTSKLVLDVLQYDPTLHKAVLYAVGNALLCDTLNEARTLAFGGGDRYKVVTLEGVLINKSGTMSGGFDSSDTRAQRFDSKEIENLKSARQTAQQKLQSVPSDREHADQVQRLETEIGSLEKSKHYFESEVKTTQEKMKRAKKEIDGIDGELKKLRTRLQQLDTALKSHEQPMAKVQGKINEITDSIFADFSKSVGVGNIREFEEKQLKTAQEQAEKKIKLAEQISRLKNELEYKRSQDLKAPMNKLEAAMAESEQQLKKLRKEEKEFRKAVEKMEKDLADLDKQSRDVKAKVEVVDSELHDIKKQMAELVKQLGAAKKQVTAKETELDQLRNRRHAVFQRCTVEQVKLPLLPRDEDEEMEEASQGLEPMQTQPGGEPSSSQAAQEREQRDDRRAVRVDYSGLDDEYKEDKTEKEIEQALVQFQTQLRALALDMDKIAPNLNAIAKLDDVNTRLKETNDTFNNARQNAEDATRKFNEIKQQRYDRFMEAFNHVSKHIDDIYKELTKSSAQPMGGVAYVSLDNPDEPYLAGIKYNAMPPLKRFRDMEQLSGGEKTVAALALLFGIHSYQPSPFFVLDEIDAALDNVNVNRIANYIRDHAGNKRDFQAIVISLKDTFYEKADALVGIYRDTEQNCSRTLTLDLSKYS